VVSAHGFEFITWSENPPFPIDKRFKNVFYRPERPSKAATEIKAINALVRNKIKTRISVHRGTPRDMISPFSVPRFPSLNTSKI